MSKDMLEKVTRLQDEKGFEGESEATRQLWQKHGRRQIVRLMEKVVDEVCTDYQRDFYYVDMSELAQHNFHKPFIWGVRRYGTYLEVLPNRTFDANSAVAHTMNNCDRTYYCDPVTSTFIRIA